MIRATKHQVVDCCILFWITLPRQITLQRSKIHTRHSSKYNTPSKPKLSFLDAGADLGGGCRGVRSPSSEMTCGFQLVFVYATSQLRHSSVVQPHLRKVRDASIRPCDVKSFLSIFFVLGVLFLKCHLYQTLSLC